MLVGHFHFYNTLQIKFEGLTLKIPTDRKLWSLHGRKLKPFQPALIDSRKLLIAPKEVELRRTYTEIYRNAVSKALLIKRYTDPYLYNKISATIQPN